MGYDSRTPMEKRMPFVRTEKETGGSTYHIQVGSGIDPDRVSIKGLNQTQARAVEDAIRKANVEGARSVQHEMKIALGIADPKHGEH